MGFTGTKLNVYIEREFIFSFLKNHDGKNNLFAPSFNAKILNPERCELRSFKNEIYDTSLFRIAIAKLKNIKDRESLYISSAKPLVNNISDIPFNIENAASIFLIEQNTELNI